MSYKYRKTFSYRGKRYDVKADSQEELLQKITEKKYLLSKGINKESNIKTHDYAEMWLETYKKPYITADTYQVYISTFKLINSYIGNRNLKDVNSADVQQMITDIYQKGYSKSVISKMISAIRQLFRQAYADEIINHNPTIAIRMPKVSEKRRRSLTEDEIKSFVEVAETHKRGLWILTMLYTGMRPSETAVLKGGDIKDGIMHIRGTKTKKSDRYIPLPKPLEGKFDKFGEDEFVFKTRFGNPVSKVLRTKWWEKFKHDVDIHRGAKHDGNKIIETTFEDGLTMYCLRHTFGTNGQRKGIPIDVLADLMGHEKIETTRQYYIHDNIESKKRAMEMLNSSYDEW